MLWKLNKICCPNICVAASGKDSWFKAAHQTQLLSVMGSVFPGGSWTPSFLGSVVWFIPFQPFLNISWALDELSVELVIPDIAGSCPCCLVEVTSVKIIDLSLEQQETCWKGARIALNFSSEGQRRVNQYFPPFPKKEQSSVSMDSHTFSFFLLPASCYLKILITLTVRESVLKEPAESIHPE